ncbi:hypothetical protein AB1F87_001593 [Vibrio mimicus]
MRSSDADFIPIFFAILIVCAGYLWIFFFADDWEITDSKYEDVQSLRDNPLARPHIISAMEDGRITFDEYEQIKESVSPRAVLASKLEAK